MNREILEQYASDHIEQLRHEAQTHHQLKRTQVLWLLLGLWLDQLALHIFSFKSLGSRFAQERSRA